MALEISDPELIAAFPGASFKERSESWVLLQGSNAIHIYPENCPIGAIQMLADGQNSLAQQLEGNNTVVVVSGKRIPVRSTSIKKIDTLKRGRVYTVSQADRGLNLEDAYSAKSHAPGWAAPTLISADTVNQLIDQIKDAVVQSIGIDNLPFGFSLQPMNIHLGERSITIVDYAKDVSMIVQAYEQRNLS